MSADVLEFRRKEGPLTEKEAIIVACRKRFAGMFGRRISDDLVDRLAEAILAAPTKTSPSEAGVRSRNGLEAENDKPS